VTTLSQPLSELTRLHCTKGPLLTISLRSNRVIRGFQAAAEGRLGAVVLARLVQRWPGWGDRGRVVGWLRITSLA